MGLDDKIQLFEDKRRLMVRSLRQNRHHIDNRKIPLLFFFIPCSADALIFKKLKTPPLTGKSG